jgi:hypothetical protein
MGVTREDYVRSGRWLDVSDAEWETELATKKYVIGCYMENDAWATKIKKNVAVHLTSSMYGRAYLKGSLETFQKLGFWVVLSYDNFINPKDNTINDLNWGLPPKDVMELVDTFLLPHHQSWGGVSYPYMWQLRLASGILQDFEYVLCANGDCIIEKPEGFPALLELMGDADIMSAGPTLEREIGTAAFLVRGKAYAKIAKHMIDHVVPFEEYEKSTQEFGNTEGRLAVAVRELGLKAAQVPVNPSCPHHKQCEQHHQPGGTFHELIGFRHIHGEHNYAYRYKHIPPEPQYFDPRFIGDEYNQIKAYWETKDKTILENWWAKD